MRVLLARAQVAREVLPRGLADLGAKVDVAPVYQARAPQTIPPEAETAFKEGAVDVLTFTSSSTVHNFVKLLGRERVRTLAARAAVAAIGPITAATLKDYGLTPQVEPKDYTIPALVEAIVDYFRRM